MSAVPQRPEEALLAALDLGAMTLALPLAQLRSIRPVIDVRRMPHATAPLFGELEHEQAPLPVYCLDATLRPLAQADADYRACVILGDGQGSFGLLCRDVEVLPVADFRRQPVPNCLRMPTSPVESLAICGERVLCCTESGALRRYARGTNPGQA